MPARSAVSQLPEEVKTQLDARLIGNGFADYEALAEWLAANGFQISKSALHRYGQKFEERVQTLSIATQQAKALVEASPDDAGAMSEALIRLVQEKIFTVLIDMEVDASKVNIGSLTKGIATLARASVRQKEFEREVRERVKAVAESVEKVAQRGGLSPELVAGIRRDILGIQT